MCCERIVWHKNLRVLLKGSDRMGKCSRFGSQGCLDSEYSLGSYIFPVPLSIDCGSRPHGRCDKIEMLVEETGSLEPVGTS
jgi:hypothetical protein